MTHQIAGYTIEKLIGRGSVGEIYSARTANGAMVALKIIPFENDVNLAEVYLKNYQKEVLALFRVNGVSTVQIHDFGQTAQYCYIATDYIEGESLDQVILKQKRIDKDKVISIVTTILECLIRLHRFGMIHRDIKPENILLCSDGSVKLIDFGLATDVVSLQNSTTVGGTFKYSSPEQTGMLAATIDFRSDLYSLGVTMFDCLLGKPPFDSNDVSELVRSHASVVPPVLAEVDPTIDPILSAIVQKLLNKDPDDRYQSAGLLMEDLKNIDKFKDIDKKLLPKALGQGLDLDHSLPPLFGRESELDKLSKQFNSAKSGQGSFCLIEGASGLGKSSLAREVLKFAQGPNTYFLSGRFQSSQSSPYSAIRECIDSFISKINRLPEKEREVQYAKIRKVAGQEGGIIKKFTKSLEDILGDLADIAPLAPAAEQDRYFKQLSNFMADLAKEFGCFVMIIDDLQWADSASLEILKRLANRIGGVPFLFVATARNDEDNLAKVNLAIGSVSDHIAYRVDLKPIGKQSIRDVILYHLGNSSFEDSLVEKFTKMTKGNPFALVEYLRTAVRMGAILPIDRKWQIIDEKFGALEVSTDVLDLVISRLDSLSSDGKFFMMYAAAVGNSFNLDVLNHCTALTSKTIHSALDEALKINLLDSDATGYSFVHDKVREAVLKKVPPDQLKSIHQDLAEALDRQNDGSAESLFSRARHYLKGQIDKNRERVFEVCCEAGSLALDKNATDEALSLLNTAFELSSSLNIANAQLSKLLEKLGMVCIRKAQFGDAEEKFRKAQDLTIEKVPKARMQFWICYTVFQSGRVPVAWMELTKAFSILGKAYPKSKFFQWLNAGYYWVKISILQKTGIGFGKAKDADREFYKLLFKMYEIGSLLNYLLQNTSVYMQMAIFQLYSSHFLGVSHELAIAHSTFAGFLGLIGKRGSIDRHGEISVKMAEQLGDKNIEMLCRTWYYLALEWSGDSVRAEKMAREIREGVIKFCDPYSVARIVLLPGQSYAIRGYSKSALQWMESQYTLVEQSKSKLLHANLLGMIYSQMMLTGRATEAIRFRDEQKKLVDFLANAKFAQTYYALNQLFVILDEREFNKDAEEWITKFESNADLGDEVYRRVGYCIVAYIWLEKLQIAFDENNANKEIFEKATHFIEKFSKRAALPMYKCHYYVMKAALARMKGRSVLSSIYLTAAQRQAGLCQSVWGEFCINLEKARALKSAGKIFESRNVAHLAHIIAAEQNWVNRQKIVEKEFGIVEVGGGSTVVNGETKIYGSGGGKRALIGNNYIDVLVKVSEATGQSLNLMDQSLAALKQILEIVSAEKAMIFLVDKKEEAKGEAYHPTFQDLKMISGMTKAGELLTEAKNYSSSCVSKVVSSGESIIVSSVEDAEQIGSKSAVEARLRSIVAVPIMLKNKLLGVLYLDSSLAKGLFSEDDVEILKAVATNIGVSLEMARAARYQLEAAELQKQLDIQSAVAEMSKKVQILVDNMQQALFSVDSQGLIVEPVSHFSCQVFGEEIAGKNVFEVVYRDIARDSELHSLIMSGFNTVFGEGSLQWDLMESNFPIKVGLKVGEAFRTLKTKVTPLWTAEETLDKMMFVVEDITDLERLESEIKRQNRRTSIIQEVLSGNTDSVIDFHENAKASMGQVKAYFEKLSSQEQYKDALRILHTLKGNARFQKLSQLTSVIHKCETEILGLRNDDLGSLGISMLPLIKEIFDAMQEYEQIINEFLKKGEGARATAVPVEDLLSCLEEIKSRISADQYQEFYQQITKLGGGGLKKQIMKFGEMVDDLSQKLGKKIEFVVTGDDVAVEKKKAQLISDCIVHLIRNSIDHGLETVDERKQSQKPEIGRIEVSIKQVNESIEIQVADDGKGINPEAVAAAALKKGVLNKDQISKMSEKEKQGIIFHSGFSSKDEASEISGRGIGMDVVKTSVESEGGSVDFESLSGVGTTFKLRFFSKSQLAATG